jgi:hypothetical protein
MGRWAGRGGNPVDLLRSIWSPESRGIFSLRNPERLRAVLLFLNARPDSEQYFSCKILHGFKSFVDFLNVVGTASCGV